MHWCARQGGRCCAKEPRFPEKLLRSRTYAQAARRHGLSARPAGGARSRSVHPAPHQAQQGAQEDRVSPQVAAVQGCDGLEGVDAAHLQARTPGGEVVLQLSRTEEGRVKHGDVPQQPVHVRS